MVATHIRRPNGIHATHWALTDHQGSVDVVLDENQQAVGRTSFDAFGGRRSASWDGPPQPGAIVGGVREFTSRGYTGHEQLDGLDIIHMNGRVYDPLIGRFLSPDPIVAQPFSSQGWNRFSYVINNPLRYTDPSGFQLYTGGMVQSCSGNCNGIGTFATVNNGSTRNGVEKDRTDDSTDGRGGDADRTSGNRTDSSDVDGAGGGSVDQDQDARGREVAATVAGLLVGGATNSWIGAVVDAILSYAGPSSGQTGYSMPSINGGRQANSAVNRDSGNETGTGSRSQGNRQGAPFRSSDLLRSTVPGQVAFDKAVNALNESNLFDATLFGTAMLGEQVLTVLTVGQSAQVGQLSRSATTQLGNFLGPKGPLLGSSYYRGAGNAGLLNHGPVRFGWSYNQATDRLNMSLRIGNWHSDRVFNPISIRPPPLE